VLTAIQETTAEKASGPDGYIGTFYKQNWALIKQDLLVALDFFFQLHDQHLAHLNTAHVVLLPKKNDAKEVRDFRPISLIHSTAKLISKLLAIRLSGELNSMVSRAQSAFIRSIQDNFIYTQNLIKTLHRSKQPGIFLKLDIAKAFDSVRWDYLMEVLRQFGFGTRWRGWISSLLRTAFTAILLNSVRGKWFKHYRGLRQGVRYPPMLFILAIEPLQRLLELATADGLLSPFSSSLALLRISMYADDVVVFVKPIREELHVVAEFLELFGKVSGLVTNREKCAVYPIRCEDINLNEVMEGFPYKVQCFPCNYLGFTATLSTAAPC
jgi:hypothetical protein